MKRVMAIGLALTLVVAACGDDDESSERPTVVVTTTVLGDLVRNVAGTDADVVVILPLGADPHDYRASSSQVAMLNSADLVVANGLGLEEGFADVLEAAHDDGVRVLEIGPLLDPIEVTAGEHGDDEADHDEDSEGADEAHDEDEGHDDADEGHDGDEDGGHTDDDDHDHGAGGDPHVWLDPIRMAAAAELVAEALLNIDPDGGYAERAADQADALRQVDAEITELIAGIPADERLLVTNHDALGYFALRYGFEVIGTVIPARSTLSDPSSGELAALVEVIKESGVRAIFAETTHPTSVAEAVAAELDREVAVVEVFTGSLGEPGSGAETLVDMLRTNAERIVAAMAG